MKPNLTIYLFVVFKIYSTLCQAQGNDSTTVINEPQKIENPYKKGQTRWLNKNQFFTEGYDWKDPAINLYLDKAIKRRATSNLVGITGASVLLLGLVGNFMGSLSKEINSSNPNEEYQVTTWPYYLGGTMVGTSIVLSLDSTSKLNKAKALQKARFRKN